jgi:hypothetical protein
MTAATEPWPSVLGDALSGESTCTVYGLALSQ